MSAMPPIATELSRRSETSLCANRYHMQRSKRYASISLFDHLVGAGEQRRWHVQAERLGGAQVDHQLELGRLQDRQLAGLCALEDAAGIDAGLAVRVLDAGAIAHQAPGSGVLAQRIYCRDAVVIGEGDDLLAPVGEQGIGNDEQGVGALLPERSERDVDVPVARGVQRAKR